MNRASARGSVSGRGSYVIELSLSLRNDTNLRSNAIAVALRTLQRKFQPMVFIGAVVHPDFGGSAESRNNNIELAVVIKIAKRRTTMAARRLSKKSSLFGQSGPFRAIQISKNCIGLVDMAVRGHGRRLHVTPADKNIFPAVVIKVGDVRA